MERFKAKNLFLLLWICLNTGNIVYGCEVLHQLSERFYNDPKVYCKGQCGKTVLNILDRLENEPHPSEFKVIYVVYEKKKFRPVDFPQRAYNGGTPIISPVVSREGESVWTFHIFLLKDGKALDLHSGTSVESVEAHLSRLFPNQPASVSQYRIDDRLSQIYLREIDGEYYLNRGKELSTRRAFSALPKDESYSLFPIVSARDWLNQNK